MTGFPLASSRTTFRAAAIAFVPELAEAPDDLWERLEATVTRLLSRQPQRTVRQLALFLRLVDGLAVVTRFARLASLPQPVRLRVLRRLERAPALLLRRGVWGLRTLVFAGYYAQPDVAAAIGYGAAPAGWDAAR